MSNLKSKLQLRQAGRPDHFEGGDLHEGVRERQLARLGGRTRRSEGREHHRSCRWRQRMRAHGSSRQCVSRCLSSAIILNETMKLWSSWSCWSQGMGCSLTKTKTEPLTTVIILMALRSLNNNYRQHHLQAWRNIHRPKERDHRCVWETW